MGISDTFKVFVGISRLVAQDSSAARTSRIISMFALRHYQTDMLDRILARLDTETEKMTPLLAVSPTGSGKGRVIASLAMILAETSDVLILTPRRRLLMQTLNQFNQSATGVMCSDIGDDRFGHDVNLIVGTWQTAINRIFDNPLPKYCIIDEAHLLPIFDAESEYANCIERLRDSGVVIIGFTATAYRGHDSIVQPDCWDLVCDVPILDLIQQGYLVPPRSIASGQATLTDSEDLESVTQAIIPELLISLDDGGFKKTLMFALDIHHAKYICQLLLDQVDDTVLVGLVHSEMSQRDIDAMIDAFDSYSGRAILVNISIINIGVDLPCVDSIAVLRSISNGSTYTQIIGRGLRLFPNKTECGVFDFGNGTERFGNLVMPALIGRKQAVNAERLKNCPDCASKNTVSSRVCHHCGHTFSFQVSINSVSVESDLLGNDVKFVTVSQLSQVNGVVICHFTESDRYIYDLSKQHYVGQRLLIKNITEKVAKVIAQL